MKQTESHPYLDTDCTLEITVPSTGKVTLGVPVLLPMEDRPGTAKRYIIVTTPTYYRRFIEEGRIDRAHRVVLSLDTLSGQKVAITLSSIQRKLLR